jgi:Ricin-type beta-trefoil lectin domain
VASSLESAYHPGTGPVKLDWDSKCLDDTNNSSSNGHKIQIWTCNGEASQNWAFYPDTDPGDVGEIVIHDKCLDASGYGTTDGTKLQLWSCTGNTNQVWEVTGYGQLENYPAEKCLADLGNTTANGTQLVLEDCYGDQGTVWAET